MQEVNYENGYIVEPFSKLDDDYRWMIIFAIIAFIFTIDLRHGTVSKMFLPRSILPNICLTTIIFFVEIIIVIYCVLTLLRYISSIVNWRDLIALKETISKFNKAKPQVKIVEKEKKNYECNDFISQTRVALNSSSSVLRQRGSMTYLEPGHNAENINPRRSINSLPSTPSSVASIQHIFNPNLSRQSINMKMDNGSPGTIIPRYQISPLQRSMNTSLMSASPNTSYRNSSMGLLPSPPSLSQMSSRFSSNCSFNTNNFAFDSPHSQKSGMNTLLDNSLSIANASSSSPCRTSSIVVSPLPVKVNTLSPVKHDDMLHTSLQELTDYINQANEQGSTVKNRSLNASWMYYGENSLNIAPELKTQIYQVAKNLPQPKKEVKIEKTEKEIIFVQSSKDYEILDICLENIRMWIDRTILKRVISQIHNVNKVIANLGKIGESSIGQLKAISPDFPELQKLIPYLEITENQNYLITRLNELSSGYCLNNYNWNAGNSKWYEKLPNDTQLIFHMFVSYMNSQLPIYSDLKKFSDKYIIICPAKLQNKPLFLNFSNLNPPNIEVIVDTESKTIEQGRNNMLTALLCFFWQIKKKHNSILDRISIGNSGLNIEWVFGED